MVVLKSSLSLAFDKTGPGIVMLPSNTSVMIVGGGPCGLMLANELGRRGVSAVLVDEKPSTAFNPQANATQARTMEHYRRLGFANDIRDLGLPTDFPPVRNARAGTLQTSLCRRGKKENPFTLRVMECRRVAPSHFPEVCGASLASTSGETAWYLC